MSDNCAVGRYVCNTRPSALGSVSSASKKLQFGIRSRHRDRYELPTRLGKFRQSVLSMFEFELDNFVDTTQMCLASRCLWNHGYVDELDNLLLPGAFPSP